MKEKTVRLKAAKSAAEISAVSTPEKATVKRPLRASGEFAGTERANLILDLLHEEIEEEQQAFNDSHEHLKLLNELFTPEQREIIVSKVCVNCAYYNDDECNCLNTYGFRRQL
jgi:hypothetical protein